mgnify:CR=1 FL=1
MEAVVEHSLGDDDAAGVDADATVGVDANDDEKMDDVNR